MSGRDTGTTEHSMIWSSITDEEINKLTAGIDALRGEYIHMPNCPERRELHAKCTRLVMERRYLFDSKCRENPSWYL